MRDHAANPASLDRLRSIMRRDLKLGDGAELPPDLPLIGGDYDLDSLDMLMLVTSIEKEFGINVSEGTIGRDAFQTLGSLAAFVDDARARIGSGG